MKNEASVSARLDWWTINIGDVMVMGAPPQSQRP